MAKAEIKCSDGSSDCFGTLETDVRFAGLDDDQLDEISEAGGTAEILLHPYQVEMNKRELSKSELESVEDDGSLYVEVTAHTICPGCGSDVSRDKEGNVIP